MNRFPIILFLLVTLLAPWASGADPVNPELSKQTPATAPEVPNAQHQEGGNLLTVNPGFEDGGGGVGHDPGTGSIAGWDFSQWLYGGTYTTKDDKHLGENSLKLEYAGKLATKKEDRATITGGQAYRLGFFYKKSKDDSPDILKGAIVRIIFYDLNNNVVSQFTSPNFATSGTTEWVPYNTDAYAPKTAVKVGIEVECPTYFPQSNDQILLFDDFSLTHIPEMRNQAKFRDYPMALEPGKTGKVKIRVLSSGNFDVLLRLSNGPAHYPEMRQPAREAKATLAFNYPVPGNISPGNNYKWEAVLVRRNAPWNEAVSSAESGAFFDVSQAGDSQIAPDNENLLYEGRWRRADPKAPVCFWSGSSIHARFRGTSLKIKMECKDGSTIGTILDDDDSTYKEHSIKDDAVVNVAENLLPGIHKITLIRIPEIGAWITFKGFILDPGCGLLKPEPFANRHVDFYGDSVTSGGDAGIFYSYSALVARELKADRQTISKGATGVAGSFIFHYTLRDYFDRENFNVWYLNDPKPENQIIGDAWDFTKRKADVVVIAIGQNDRFRAGTTANWKKCYREFVAKIRAIYPEAHIFCTDTTMSGDTLYWQNAVDPILAETGLGGLNADGKIHFQSFRPGQGHGEHPTKAEHHDMAYGNVIWNGLIDWIGDTVGW